ncbi:hypothetical protein N0V86_000071, partial [Didymella sp. IMI 355093]
HPHAIIKPELNKLRLQHHVDCIIVDRLTLFHHILILHFPTLAPNFQRHTFLFFLAAITIIVVICNLPPSLSLNLVNDHAPIPNSKLDLNRDNKHPLRLSPDLVRLNE